MRQAPGNIALIRLILFRWSYFQSMSNLHVSYWHLFVCLTVCLCLWVIVCVLSLSHLSTSNSQSTSYIRTTIKIFLKKQIDFEYMILGLCVILFLCASQNPISCNNTYNMKDGARTKAKRKLRVWKLASHWELVRHSIYGNGFCYSNCYCYCLLSFNFD